MRYEQTPLAGVYLIHPEPLNDDRGFFARMFCSNEFQERHLEDRFVQANNSYSARKGTLRGLHYQLGDAAEVKLVRCIRGSFYDVVVDLRRESPTFLRSFGTELSADNRTMMYVPKGCAHGFLTLTDDSEVLYFVSSPYSKELERGLRWDDPRLGITWPFKPQVVSERDQSHADFNEKYHLGGG